ncbi:MAG: tryptophan synthase subunit alpha [Candidatus Omnitrophica bacterium]|nr:tryptophan synthase subunit alpha [Candidatus Omnitrophota bacterium]
MQNRIDKKFAELKKKGQKAFIAFVTAGDPDLETTVDLVRGFEKAGVDIVELGVPFSDPLADGPIIQAASQRALSNGTTIPKIFAAVRAIRQFSEIPLALMTYYNPVFHYGESNFVKDAKAAGVDGIIVPDLPPEEAKTLIAMSRKSDFATVFFLSPTTTDRRIKKIVNASTGFIYYVSLTGVTGTQQGLPKDIIERIKKVKRATNMPICVGFGVSTAQDVQLISRVADGVIVGSAIINEIQKHKDSAALTPLIVKFVQQLSSNLKE